MNCPVPRPFNPLPQGSLGTTDKNMKDQQKLPVAGSFMTGLKSLFNPLPTTALPSFFVVLCLVSSVPCPLSSCPGRWRLSFTLFIDAFVVVLVAAELL